MHDESRTVVDALRATIANHADKVALRTLHGETTMTWGEVGEEIDRLSRGLCQIGLRRGDTIGFMLRNRPEFNLLDAAAMQLGATCFSIYNTSSPEQIAYLLTDAQNKIVVVESDFAPTVAACGVFVENVVVIGDDVGSRGTLSFDELRQLGEASPVDLDAGRLAVAPEDIICLIYTSGTTGPPKGVQLTHANIIAEAKALFQVMEVPAGSRTISFLPSAHVGDRFFTYYSSLILGLSVTTCEDMNELPAYLVDARPEWLASVPRTWDKLRSHIEATLSAGDGPALSTLEESLAPGLERVRRAQARKAIDPELVERCTQAETTVLADVRRQFGLDALAHALIGGVAASTDILEFFGALNVELLELWGLSETSAVATINPHGRARFGSVGIALPTVELAIADDGEILMRGPIITSGYRNMPEQTREAFDENGWFLTGDVGRIDEDGYLFVIDRKKELIINAAGKNMSPTNIESALKVGSPLIGQICVIGDQRPYNTALIVLNPATTQAYAQSRGLNLADLADLSENDEILEELARGIAVGNAKLSRVEQIKRWSILAAEWSPAGGELTPTLKLKRRVINEKYGSEIDALYEVEAPRVR